MYAVEVQTTVTPLERNRVGINIAVTEGEVAKIRGINIVGAEAFAEDELLGQFVLRTPGWLTWYTKHDRYSRDKLAADLETLRSFYQNRGYLDFSDRVDAGLDHARPQGHLHHGQHHRGREVHGDRRAARRPAAAAARGAGEAGAAQGGRGVLAREAHRQHQGDHRPPRQRRLRLRQRQRDPATSTRKSARSRSPSSIDPGRRVYVRRINVAGNSQDARRGGAPRDAPARGRLLRRLEDPALAPAHRPHPVLQRRHGRDPAGGGQPRPGRRRSTR